MVYWNKLLVFVSNPFLDPSPEIRVGCLRAKYSRQEGMFLDFKNRGSLSYIFLAR